jgi:hypothetical protein
VAQRVLEQRHLSTLILLLHVHLGSVLHPRISRERAQHGELLHALLVSCTSGHQFAWVSGGVLERSSKGLPSGRKLAGQFTFSIHGLSLHIRADDRTERVRQVLERRGGDVRSADLPPLGLLRLHEALGELVLALELGDLLRVQPRLRQLL